MQLQNHYHGISPSTANINCINVNYEIVQPSDKQTQVFVQTQKKEENLKYFYRKLKYLRFRDLNSYLKKNGEYYKSLFFLI